MVHKNASNKRKWEEWGEWGSDYNEETETVRKE